LRSAPFFIFMYYKTSTSAKLQMLRPSISLLLKRIPMSRFFLSKLALICLFISSAFPSNVVVLPQENSGGTTGYIYSPEPFTQIGTFTTDPLSFQAVWHPNGQKF